VSGYPEGAGWLPLRVLGVRRRHADFVARSAIAYMEMVLDTLHDPNVPWHQEREAND